MFSSEENLSQLILVKCKNTKTWELVFIKRTSGGAGYRSPYFSHAKRALYHLSYTPYMITFVPIWILKEFISFLDFIGSVNCSWNYPKLCLKFFKNYYKSPVLFKISPSTVGVEGFKGKKLSVKEGGSFRSLRYLYLVFKCPVLLLLNIPPS